MTTIDPRFAYPGWQGPFVKYSEIGERQGHAFEYVVFDVETTGFDPAKGDRMLEVCAIRVTSTGEVLDRFTTLLNPGVTDVGAEHIHGISVEMLKGAPTFDEIFDQLIPVMNGAIFVAHHAKFDESFIAAEANRYGIKLNQMPGLCTYWLAREVVQDSVNHKLATLAQHFALETGRAHSAADDALVVVQLLPLLLERISGISLTTQPANQSPIGKYAKPLAREHPL